MARSKGNGAAGRVTYRWMRQIHLWLGAWGALAAVLYGITGLVMNHRFGDGAWPQGESNERGRVELAVPHSARTSPEALSTWLRATQGLDAQVIRKGGGRGASPDSGERWTFSGGTASSAWGVEYTAGEPQALLKRTDHSLLAAFNRLHKAVGGGWAWILLADSFAIAMTLLGITGLWMWARGRSPREWLFSVLFLSTVVSAVVLLPLLA